MNYVKKMCILRQIKQGFSGDGRPLTGLIKIEQYGKNLAVEVSVINFAPLSSGEYFCLIADETGKTELLPLRGKSLFNVVTDLNLSNGFCGVICFVKNGIFPVAYGTNGNHVYDWRKLVSSAVETKNAFKKPTPSWAKEVLQAESSVEEQIVLGEEKDEKQENEPPVYAFTEQAATKSPAKEDPASTKKYDDESVASENYYQKENDQRENEDERVRTQKAVGNAQAESRTENENQTHGADLEEDGDADGVLHPFKTEGDGYYRSVKSEIDELFEKYPKDDSLKKSFPNSEWIRVGGTEKAPEQLVGVVYEELTAKYICYAIPTQTPASPPEEIEKICIFVPRSLFDTSAGWFVIFQNAATGECIKPESA